MGGEGASGAGPPGTVGDAGVVAVATDDALGSGCDALAASLGGVVAGAGEENSGWDEAEGGFTAESPS